MGFSTTSCTPKLLNMLEESEAWAAALAWRDQLQGHVRLETDDDAVPTTIIPTFEWIRFDFDPHAQHFEQTVACARAATIAWFALSCCEGYSGTENAEFWRRVFVELVGPRENPRPANQAPQSPITQATRFFTTPGQPFPRVKVSAKASSAVDIFVGRRVISEQSADEQLTRLLTKLRPYIRPAHGRRRLSVSVDNVSGSDTAALLKEASLDGDSPLMFPRMQLVSVVIDESGITELEGFLVTASSSTVRVTFRGKASQLTANDRLIRGLLPEPGATGNPTAPVLIPSLVVDQQSAPSIAVLCSSLPHIPSIQRLEIDLRAKAGFDLAWLGYALFHPDAESTQSGLTSLDIRIHDQADLAGFKRMARGNNIISHDNWAYTEGRVSASTVVWSHPADAPGATQQARLHQDTWMNLCVSTTRVLEDSTEWICVVHPGYGLGWIPRSRIVATRTRAPGRCCVQALRVRWSNDEVQDEKILELLEIIGGRLKTLHLDSSEPISKSSLQLILKACPRLQTLRVRHDGSLWSDGASNMLLSSIEELELISGDSSTGAVRLMLLHRDCLSRVRSLRIISPRDPRRSSLHAKLVSVCLAELPSLQYFHWSSGKTLSGRWPKEAYERHDQITDQVQLVLSRLGADLAIGRLSLDYRLAFLSVLVDHEGNENLSATKNIGNDVASLIFQFTTSSLKRDIAIDS